MKEKMDLRVYKTKKALYDALIKLIKDKAFEEIKVADICNEAFINRSTFYAHYNDKYELLIDFINNLKDTMLKDLEQNEQIVNTKKYYMEMISLILNHIESKKEIYSSILISNQSSIIVDIIGEVAIKDINKRIEISHMHKTSVPTDIMVIFYLGAVTSVCMEWLKGNDKYTKEEILKYLEELIPDLF